LALRLTAAAAVSAVVGAVVGAALTARREEAVPCPSRAGRCDAADRHVAGVPHPGGPVQVPPLPELVVTSPFGPRGARFHTGVDLRARSGAPLQSVAGGVVERTGRGGPGGNTVVVKLDSGWRAGYAHLSRVDVRVGERVGAGARVGLAGATGKASGPHLHFELRGQHGRLVDPAPHLSPHGLRRGAEPSSAAASSAASEVRLFARAVRHSEAGRAIAAGSVELRRWRRSVLRRLL
jgi:hypothetical protein